MKGEAEQRDVAPGQGGGQPPGAPVWPQTQMLTGPGAHSHVQQNLCPCASKGPYFRPWAPPEAHAVGIWKRRHL